MDDSTVSKWKSGERTPNADVLAAMLELCSGSADYVLGLKPQPWEPGDLKSAFALVEKAVEASGQLSAHLQGVTVKATGTLSSDKKTPKP